MLRMIKIPTRTILAVIGFWYIGKFFVLAGLGGASMACADGGSCAMPFWKVLKEISPIFAYGLGGALFISQKWTKFNRDSIENAIGSAFNVHLMILLATLIYMLLLAPLAPQIFSYYSSPGAKIVRFIYTLLPAILGMIIIILSFKKSEA